MYILQIPGYSSYYKNQDEWRGGGVGMYIKDIIKHKERQDFELDKIIEYMWVEYQGKSKNYLVGAFYQPRPEDWYGLKS